MLESNKPFISQYIKWFESVFGEEIGKKYLNSKGMYKNEPFNFIEKRIKQIGTNQTEFSISGCTKCIVNGLNIRNQDAPGFIVPLSEIKYVIIGLEVNHKNDFHIAYDYYPDVGYTIAYDKILKKYKDFFSDIKECSYITDIAKCRSTNLNKSRNICRDKVLLEELSILLRFKRRSKIIIILQGTGVRKYFKKIIEKDKKIIFTEKKPKNQLFS